MLELLCLSDLHLGEEYAFLTYGKNWDWSDQTRILPLFSGAARLAGLNESHPPEIQVETLVLLGDIFELATARIETAAQAGRNFFNWMFQWLKPDRIVFVPGNHDHVFWMWWMVPPQGEASHWWEMAPGDVRPPLTAAYGGLRPQVSNPGLPVGIGDAAWRFDLIRAFFGPLIEPTRFYLTYPAFAGPSCGPPGFRDRPFKTLFTHGHFNDPTFVRPAEAGLVARGMHWLVEDAPAAADMSDLDSAEHSTWQYTNRFWYPPNKESTWGERLYLMSIFFATGNPCRHPQEVARRFVSEPAADLDRAEASGNDFYDFIAAAFGETWYTKPLVYVYGHTHHGGAMPLDPTVLLYNTGGWLKKTKDKPPHAHLFAIDSEGVTRMIRADFG